MPADLEDGLHAMLQRGVDLGLHRGVQLAVVGADGSSSCLTVGRTDGGCPVDDKTQLPWTCASKIVGVLALARLVSGGAVAFDDSLGTHLPVVRGSPIGSRTVSDLLTHRTGLSLDTGDDIATVGADRVLARILEAANDPPTAVAPTSYKVWSHWFLLSQLIEEVTGVEYATFARSQILEVLNLKGSTVCAADVDPVNSIRFELGRGDQAEPIPSDLGAMASGCVAGSSFHGPATELATLLQPFIDDDRRAVLGIDADVLTAIATPARIGEVDTTLGWDPTWGLGLMLDARAWPGYPAKNTIGHMGLAGSAIAFADLERKLVVVGLFGRAPGSLAATARSRAVLASIRIRRA